MKKRLLLMYILILLVFARQINAEYSQNVFDRWVYSGLDISNNNVNFSWSADKAGEKLIVAFDEAELQDAVVRKGDCESNSKFKVCFVDNKVYNQSEDSKPAEYHLKIDKLVPKIFITRKIEKTTFLIGEETEIEVEIENNGSVAAQNVVYMDYFPNFDITEMEGCGSRGKEVVWEGVLEVNEKKKCSYTIEALNKTEFQSTAKVNYSDGKKSFTESSNTVQISIPDYELEVKSYVNRSQIKPKGTTSILITLGNTGANTTIRVNKMRIILPEGLNATYFDGFKLEDNVLITKSFALGKSQVNNYTIEVGAKMGGIHKIEKNVEYTAGSIKRNISKYASVNVSLDNLTIKYSISNSTLESGKESQLKIEVVNPSYFDSFNNIRAEVKTNITELRVVKLFDRLRTRSDGVVIDKKFTAPNVTENTTYDIRINLSYNSVDGQQFKLVENKKVIIVHGQDVQTSSAIVNESAQAGIGEEEEEIQWPETSVKEEEKEKKVFGLESALFKSPLLAAGIVIIVLCMITLFIANVIKGRKKKEVGVYDIKHTPKCPPAGEDYKQPRVPPSEYHKGIMPQQKNTLQSQVMTSKRQIDLQKHEELRKKFSAREQEKNRVGNVAQQKQGTITSKYAEQKGVPRAAEHPTISDIRKGILGKKEEQGKAQPEKAKRNVEDIIDKLRRRV